MGLFPGYASAAPEEPCPNPVTTSPDGTTVYGSPCATVIVVTSRQVRTIHAGEGDNVVYAGPNVEAIYGEGGDDVVYGGSSVILVEGGAGDDVIYGEPTEAEIGGEGEIDYETAKTSSSLKHRVRRHSLGSPRQRNGAVATSSITCTENPCLGGNGGQELHGGAGADEIFGERGDDEIWGEGGNDALYGGTGDDKIWGGEGNDLVAGGPGADEIFGNNGNDLMRGDGTIDKIYGGAGTDTLSFTTAVTPGFGGAYPSGIKQVEGFPEEGSGEGRGVFVRIDGGATTCGYPSCNNGAALGGGDDEIAVGEIENVIGSPYADIIVGSSGANKIYGGGGPDVIVGSGGGDELYGGAEGDYIEGGSEATAYGGVGQDNCVGTGSTNGCDGTEARVAQHESGTMSAGLMLTTNPAVAHDTAYMVGSNGNDEVNVKLNGATITFTSYGSTRFAGESEGCSYKDEGEEGGEGKTAECTLPAGTSAFDAVVMAGMKGADHPAVVGSEFLLKTSPVVLGGEGNDSLGGSGKTEDVLVDGNGAGSDALKGYGYDDWLLNNEGIDAVEGGNGNDLFLSSTTCDGDTLNGAEEGSGGDGEAKNNASWAKMPSSVGGVTAALETQSSGSYWNESSKAPACTSGSVDNLYGMDDLEGSNQSDALFGNSGANNLLGHKGEDALYGEAGNDTILAQDEEKDKINGGGSPEDECRIDRGLDEFSGCGIVKPPPTPTTTYATVSGIYNGQPGSVTVTGHVYAEDSSSLNGTYLNVNFEKEEGGKWVYKNSAHPTITNNYYEVVKWMVGVGNWRTRTVFPEQGAFAESQSEYHSFTINPTGYTTETFLTIKSVVNGQPGNVSLYGHVNVTTAEGGPINGLYVNVNFSKEEGGKWVYKNSAQPTISNSYYEVNKWGVSVGSWRVRAVFPQQGYYLSSESIYHYFTVNKK